MPKSRFSASVGAYHGELRLQPDGMTFVPVTIRATGQMVLGVAGWCVAWSKVDGIERMARSVIRVHFDGLAHNAEIVIHGSLREFFRDVDAMVAAGLAPMRLTA